jgi:tRNA pseudouridine55 synthase
MTETRSKPKGLAYPLRGKQVQRQVNGVVLLDKPIGLSSNAALQIVKHLYSAHKAGHTGSLDPLASGLLPICLGEATKLSGFLLNANKTYRFLCRLGITTNTGDAEGEIINTRPVTTLPQVTVETIMRRFVGEIQQVPPMYSALKHQGQRLYKLARQGLWLERQPRQVTIHTLRLLRLQGNLLECEVGCSKGTYVRSLAEDLGEALGCGAHIVELRRTGVEPFNTLPMVTLETLRLRAKQGFTALEAVLLPADTAIRAWPAVHVHSLAKQHLFLGQSVSIPKAPAHGWVRLYENEGSFLGIGEVLGDGRVAPRRLIQKQL